MHCPACGYDLRGLDGRRCPECGTIPALHGPRPIPRRHAEPAARRLRATTYLAGFALLLWTSARLPDEAIAHDALAGLALWQVIFAAAIVWRAWPDVRRHRRLRRPETRAYLRSVAAVIAAVLVPLPVAWLAPAAWHGAIGLLAAGAIGVAGAVRYAVAAGMAAALLRRRGRGGWAVTARVMCGTFGVLLAYAGLASIYRSAGDATSLLVFGWVALLGGIALASSATREIERGLTASRVV